MEGCRRLDPGRAGIVPVGQGSAKGKPLDASQARSHEGLKRRLYRAASNTRQRGLSSLRVRRAPQLPHLPGAATSA